MRRILSLLVFVLPAVAQQAGQPLPPWSVGFLDLHFIHTGRGDAALFVLPDGTSLQFDAGDGGWPPGSPRGVAQRPGGERPAGERIARYVRRVLPSGAGGQAIDYGVLSHLHGDHMDGFPELARHVPIRKMLDRGWPDYNFPAPVPADQPYMQWIRSGATPVERFQAGRNDQLVLARDPAAYPEFEIRNTASNGEVWTGSGSATRQRFPEGWEKLPLADRPNENQSSLGIRVSYGKFDFYTGGDIPGVPRPGAPDWHDIETPVAQAVGPVEVAAPNHHGNRDSTNAFFVSALRPRLWILQVWSSDHPGHDVLDRMFSDRLYPGPRDVLATAMSQANKDVIGPLLERLASDSGHIVVRVEPGGDVYRALVVEDGDESMRVKAVLGPFRSN